MLKKIFKKRIYSIEILTTSFRMEIDINKDRKKTKLHSHNF